MSTTTLFVLLALLGGVCLPTQAGINVQLGHWARSPVLAALISFAVGTLGLLLYSLLNRLPLPPFATAGAQPWWLWSGGLLGAFFVAMTVIITPRLGATTLMALVLAGQLVASLLYDHFGLLGYSVHPVTPGRLLGVALLAVGVVLIKVF